MNIFSIYYTHKPGGFCKRLYRLLTALALDGHNVTYLSLDEPPKTLSPSINWRRIPFALKNRSGLIFWILFSLWSPVFCLWLVSRQTSSTRWVVFSPYYATLIAPLKILSGIPLICFIRSKLAPASESQFTAKIETLTQKICFKISDRVVVQTQANKELAKSLNCPASKIAVLPNNIDLIVCGSIPDSYPKPIQVLTSGVFTRKKNLGFLFAVWQSLSKLSNEQGLPCPQLMIVGLIRDMDFKSALPEQIKVQSWVENLSSSYQASQVYLHPSLHEGMPNSVLEALAEGLIVLAADTPELSELMDNQELLFPLLKPEYLAIRLLEIQQDRNKFNLLRKLSQKRARELCFDWDVAAKLLAIN